MLYPCICYIQLLIDVWYLLPLTSWEIWSNLMMQVLEFRLRNMYCLVHCHLYVRDKWYSAMFAIVNHRSCHNWPGTQCQFCIILTNNRCGYFSNGSVSIVAPALSFMVHMYLSTTGTCNSHAVILSIMPCNSSVI